MWSEQGSPTFLFVIAASIIVHVVSLAVLPAADAAPPAASVTAMFTVDPLPPPPPPPLPAPLPQAEPVAVREDVVARAPARRSPRPAAPHREAPPREIATTEPAPGPEAPMDFSGVTLTNESSSWSSPTGNGEPQPGPITTPSRGTGTRPGRAHRAPTGGSSDRVVAVGDLSRRPKAPDLDKALEANYPSDARRAGTTGKAVVRARILRDGSVGTIRVVSESAEGFGAACKRTLTGSHWQPPLDASKEPVATDVNYTCTFAVAR